ncbi:hypothetical protein ACFONB_02545 [Sphingopyxis italica]
MTGWEGEEVIFLEAKLAWARSPRNSRSSNRRVEADFSRTVASYLDPATPRRNPAAQIRH